MMQIKKRAALINQNSQGGFSYDLLPARREKIFIYFTILFRKTHRQLEFIAANIGIFITICIRFIPKLFEK